MVNNMQTLLHSTLAFFRDECGPTVVEYGVLLALIIVLCVGILLTLGANVAAIYTQSNNVIIQVPGAQ